MAACDAGAHAAPGDCGRCPRALAKSLVVALSTLRPIGLPYLLVVCFCSVLLLSKQNQPGRGLWETSRTDTRNCRRRSSSTAMGMSGMSSQGMWTRWCGVLGLLVPRAITHYSGRRRMRAGGGAGVRSRREAPAGWLGPSSKQAIQQEQSYVP